MEILRQRDVKRFPAYIVHVKDETIDTLSCVVYTVKPKFFRRLPVGDIQRTYFLEFAFAH